MRWCGLLPNIKGPLAGQNLKLLPWQPFVVADLYGFVERGRTTHRFRQAIIFVPRGNGKTTFATKLMLYMAFADGEGVPKPMRWPSRATKASSCGTRRSRWC
jgi:phage terminase large subunit-like protein